MITLAGSSDMPPFDPEDRYNPDPVRHVRYARWWLNMYAQHAIGIFGYRDAFQTVMLGMCYASRKYRTDLEEPTIFCSYATWSMRVMLSKDYSTYRKFFIMPWNSKLRRRDRGRLTLFTDLDQCQMAEISDRTVDGPRFAEFEKDEHDEWMRARFTKMLTFLNPRQRDIIERMATGQTLDAISKVHGISRERVRQISDKSLKFLARIFENKQCVEDNL